LAGWRPVRKARLI